MEEASSVGRGEGGAWDGEDMEDAVSERDDAVSEGDDAVSEEDDTVPSGGGVVSGEIAVEGSEDGRD